VRTAITRLLIAMDHAPCRTLPTLVRGEHFGEMALLPVGGENGTPRARTATVSAITMVECLSLSREVFLDVTTEGAAFYQSSNAMVASGLLVDKG
jgi:CRP-like cAMP-binding protein